MYEVAPTLIESATQPRQCSFSELGPPHTVDYFVSHWSGGEFAKLILALEAFADTVPEEDPAFWICTFANNQWSLELGDDLSGCPFELALAKAKAVVMVLDDGAVALTRIWCLYEVLRAHVLEREFHIVTHNGVLTAITDESAAKNATSELKEDVMTLLRVLLILDAETAGCSVKADKVKILWAVHLAVGIPQLSIVLQALLAETALRLMEAVGAFSMYTRVDALEQQADSIAWSDRSALHCAAQESAAAVDWVLTDSCDDLEARDSKGATPLVLAARFNHADTLERLVEAGADVESRDNSKRTPIIWASWNGHTSTVEKLASVGADVNAADENGKTGFMLAALGDHTATVEALAQLGVDVNAATKNGFTGLIYAAVVVILPQWRRSHSWVPT